MRFVIYTIFLGGWMYMWWWTYVYHIKTCDRSSAIQRSMRAEESVPYPLSFKWSDAMAMISEDFEAWRDSIVHNMGENEMLEITGLAYRDETSDVAELGMQRAHAIKQLFSASLPAEKILEFAQTAPLTADIKHRYFPAYRLRVLSDNAYVHEKGDCAMIYFPFDSTTLTEVADIENYLDRLKQYVIGTRTSLTLQAWSDANDAIRPDTALLSWRLNTLKGMLTNVGISPSLVTVVRDTLQHSIDCLPVRDSTYIDHRAWILLQMTK